MDEISEIMKEAGNQGNSMFCQAEKVEKDDFPWHFVHSRLVIYRVHLKVEVGRCNS